MPGFKEKRRRFIRKQKKGGQITARLVRVERVLRAGREVKVARLSGEKNVGHSIAQTNLINLMPDIPNNGDLAVGTNDGAGRDGNEVRLKKIIIKSWIQYAPSDVNNRVPRDQANVMARHLIIRQKDQQSSSGLTLTAGAFVADELLESGEFNQGNEFRNLMSPINRDIFTVKSDRQRAITNAVDTTDPNSDAEANPHNFVVFNKTITFGKMGMKLTFSKDSGVVQPVQFPWVMCAGYCNTNGTSASNNAARIFYDVTAFYTDA